MHDPTQLNTCFYKYFCLWLPRRYKLDSVVSSDSSDEGIIVPIGLPGSTTTTTGIERQTLDTQKHLSDGLSSEIDSDEASTINSK